MVCLHGCKYELTTEVEFLQTSFACLKSACLRAALDFLANIRFKPSALTVIGRLAEIPAVYKALPFMEKET
jgi:hypothetical protein